MSLLDKVQKLERQIEKLASRTDVPLEPIEIRRAVLDEIEDLVQPSGRSKRVFPYTRVVVEVVAGDAHKRAAMDAVLGDESDLATAVSDRLRGAGCPVPRQLEVHTRMVRRPGSEWETGRVFRVMCERAGDAAGRQAAPPPTVRSSPARAIPGASDVVEGATLTVIKGDTTRSVYPLSAARTNIGRLAEVVDKDKRVVRRNQVVFTEREDGTNQSVSRAHAHIAAANGEFRLFDDHSTYGTRIFRGGRTIPLPSGSPRGTRLHPGDEIYIGQACLRFEQMT